MVLEQSLPDAICPLCQEKKYSYKGVATLPVDGHYPVVVAGVYTCDQCGHVILKTPTEMK